MLLFEDERRRHYCLGTACVVAYEYYGTLAGKVENAVWPTVKLNHFAIFSRRSTGHTTVHYTAKWI